MASLLVAPLSPVAFTVILLTVESATIADACPMFDTSRHVDPVCSIQVPGDRLCASLDRVLPRDAVANNRPSGLKIALARQCCLADGTDLPPRGATSEIPAIRCGPLRQAISTVRPNPKRYTRLTLHRANKGS